MVKNFQYLTIDGIHLNLNLGVNVNTLDGNDDKSIELFYKGQDKGITWSYGDRKIIFIEKRYNIEGYPTPDLNKVVVIYPEDHFIYPSPNNAIIYNADGSLYMQLKCPQLISDLAKQSRQKPVWLFFERVSWAKDSKGNTITAITISFNRDWREKRVLDTETGEFGEVLSSGMR